MKRLTLLLALAPPLLTAHRLDEYLQATLLSIHGNRVSAEMTLTPGVAVFEAVMGEIDRDRNGVVSSSEQRAYADRVLRDLSIKSDGHRLQPQVSAVQFPSLAEMKEWRGGIRLTFTALLPPGNRERELTIENRHEAPISAYLVNCLAPTDPSIQVRKQHRNYSQSQYRVEYADAAGEGSTAAMFWLAPAGLLLLGRFGWLWRGRGRPKA